MKFINKTVVVALAALLCFASITKAVPVTREQVASTELDAILTLLTLMEYPKQPQILSLISTRRQEIHQTIASNEQLKPRAEAELTHLDSLVNFLNQENYSAIMNTLEQRIKVVKAESKG